MRPTVALVVVSVLGTSLSAIAQETRTSSFNLLDEPPLARAAVEDPEDQEKKQEQKEKEPPTVKIEAGPLQDDLRVGPTNKPLWTDDRPSPLTRIYLQVDPGDVGFEQWFDIRVSKQHGVPTEVRMSEEFEFGLGYRMQLDMYLNTIFLENGATSTLEIRSWAGELRYALANWGEIPANPTLYLEYILWNNTPAANADGASSSIEGKILLGDNLGPEWRWGSNLFLEHTLNGSVLETGVTLSVFKTLIDKVLSGGFAAQYVYEADGPPLVPSGPHVRTRGLYLGPTAQIRFAPAPTEVEVNGVPTKITKPRAHLDIEPTWGLTGESDKARVQIVFGWDF